MENIVTAESFYRSWLKACKQSLAEMLRCWSNGTSYSALVFRKDSGLLQLVADDLGLQSYREYYSIDAVLFTETDRVPDTPKHNTWLRRIRVAFEHENEVRNIYQEASHLAITNADLRVLVTYPNNGGEDELAEVGEIIAGNTLSGSMAFLLILGWKNSNTNELEWDGYVYKNGDWELIGSVKQRTQANKKRDDD